MKKRPQTMPKCGTEYNTFHKENRNKLRQGKEERFNEKSAEIE